MPRTAPSQRRRAILRGTLALAAALPLLGSLAGARAAKARLDPDSERARQLGYAHDAAATARPSADQSCARCAHFTPVGDGAWGECNVFSERLVDADGWCRSFYPRG